MDEKYRQWRLLFLYQLYRLVTVAVFYALYFYSPQAQTNTEIYFSLWGLYFAFGIVFIALWWRGHPDFSQQIFLIGTVDVLCMSFMLSLVGTMQSGFGILLMVSIAVLSILSSGRLAIFFAALASCILLGSGLFDYLVASSRNLGHMYQIGIYGAGFFAIALTSAYLARRLKHFEQIAKERSRELASMQLINEYIVERLSSGIIYTTMNQDIKLLNQAARLFFSWNHDYSPLTVSQLSNELAVKLDTFLKQKKVHEVGQSILKDSHVKVHFSLTAIDEHPAVLIVLEDMRQIAQQAQQLKLASLGRFSASIAHELRNPLGVISHAAQLLGEENEPLSDSDARLRELILNHCERMNGVIKNVLQLSRREQARPEPILPSVFFKHVQQSVLPHQQGFFHASINVEHDEEIYFDKSQLEQVLVILIENAMKHGQNEKGEVNMFFIVTGDKEKVQIIIRNEGVTIPRDKRQMVFEPFYTTGNAGTGMGLFIARDLCEINQATLTLADEDDGVCFIIGIKKNKEIIV